MNKFNPVKDMTDADVKDLARVSRSAYDTLGKVTTSARIAGARALFAATARGMIGKDSGHWAGMPDFVRDAGIVTEKGTAPSSGTLTGLRRIGKALSIGFDPEGKDAERFGVLSSEVNNDETIRTLLDSERPTLTALRKAVDNARAERDRRAAKSNEKRGAQTGTKTQTGKGKGQSDKQAEKALPAGHAGVMLLVKALDVAIKATGYDTSPTGAADWAKVEKALHDIETREVALLRRATEGKGKGKATGKGKVTTLPATGTDG